jgi:hypothetical protein
MLKLVSKFVLEVLPFVLSALIAAVVVPGFLYSQRQPQLVAGSASPNGSDTTLPYLGCSRRPPAETTPTNISIKPRPEVFMSRNWQAVSRAIQQLAAGRYAVKSEGMFPYDTHYVLATDEEIERLNGQAAAMGERLCA